MYKVDALHAASHDEAERTRIAEFCRVAQAEADNRAIDSIRIDGWETNPSSLMWAVRRTRFDFPNGIFHIVSNEETDVSVAGAYISDFDPCTTMVGVRAWTLPEHRSRFLLGDYVLPLQLLWAVGHGSDIAMMTFAPYNRWLAKMILRAASGRALALGQANSAAFMDWTAHPTLCRIKEVEQIVLYKQLGVEDRMPDLSGIDTKKPSGVV